MARERLKDACRRFQIEQLTGDWPAPVKTTGRALWQGPRIENPTARAMRAGTGLTPVAGVGLSRGVQRAHDGGAEDPNGVTNGREQEENQAENENPCAKVHQCGPKRGGPSWSVKSSRFQVMWGRGARQVQRAGCPPGPIPVRFLGRPADGAHAVLNGRCWSPSTGRPDTCARLPWEDRRRTLAVRPLSPRSRTPLGQATPGRQPELAVSCGAALTVPVARRPIRRQRYPLASQGRIFSILSSPPPGSLRDSAS